MLSLDLLERCRWAAPAIAATLLLAACGGGSGGTPTVGGGSSTGTCDSSGAGSVDDCGVVLVAVTDAEGDFVSYSVDILSLTLTRPGGASVETLPAATRVDFAQLTDLSDLLSAATLRPGDFVGGRIRLDYSNAEIFVEAGGDVVEAEVVDENGEPLAIEELEIELADRDRLMVTRGRTHFLSIDFDLEASHDVDTSQSPVQITARPYIVAEVEPIDDKELRLRGALLDVDLAAGSYTVAVRPWHRRDGDFGTVTVVTTDTTSLEIGGETYVGGEGLEALAALPSRTLTVAFGTLNLAERELVAEVVHAGDSVGGDGIDAVYGNVVARDGDRLTVKGAFAVTRDRAARFHRTVIVEVGLDTKVLKTGEPDALLDPNAVSVGQRIVAFGEFAADDGADPSAADARVLDATAGWVRMLPTHLRGTVTSVMPGQLEMSLRAIDRLGIELFDFSGTGVSSGDPADPAAYEVATGSLSLAALAPGEPASVVGFVTPFGMAPPDFDGRTVIDHRSLPAAITIGWDPDGTTAPFSVMSPDGVVPDLENPALGERHHLQVGRRIVDLLELPTAPSVAPSGERGLYGLWERGHIELFADFDGFVEELTARLGAGQAAVSMTAYGRYEESTQTLSAVKIAVHLKSGE